MLHKSRLTVRRGFTLIELLVVIAIIAILAAILFPVFARARENARRASCMSNLKQINLGWMQYIQDYDERFPAYNGFGAVGGWPTILQPYLKSVQIFKCPSDTFAPQPAGTNGYADYAVNTFVSATGSPGVAGLAGVTEDALTVNFMDDFTNNGVRWESGCAGDSTCAAGPGLAIWRAANSDTAPGFRHLEGMNFAFVDGHVKWLKSVSATQSANVYNAVTPGSTSGSNPTFNPTP
jgi:prepilin-type N-terminal cleavage/methylation domain-containing protein/prepilin-type processing-associated H-X9-DG protein